MRIIVAGLAVAAAAMSFYQSSQLVPLIDFTWCTENAYRISLGQRPFVDVEIATAPGTYVVQAALMKLFGPFAILQRIYACVGAALSLFMTYCVLRRYGLSAPLCLLLSVPQVLTTFVIYPWPVYDNDAMLATLAAMWWLLRTRELGYRTTDMVLLGVLLSVPCFFKQNIGGIYAATTMIGLLGLSIAGLGPTLKAWIAAALGTLIVPATVITLLYGAAGAEGLRSAYYWTFENAARAHPFQLSALSAYFLRNWITPITIWSAVIVGLRLFRKPDSGPGWILPLLFAVPAYYFVWLDLTVSIGFVFQINLMWPPILIVSIAAAIASLRQASEPACFRALILVSSVGMLTAAFVSQEYIGSTYGHWPLFSILLGLSAQCLHEHLPQARPIRLLLPLVATVTVGLAVYDRANSRLSYIPWCAGRPVSSQTKALSGLATPGPWFPAFDELVRITNDNIPHTDRVITLPGEDPFYFATRRQPQLPLFQLTGVTFPHQPVWMIDQALQSDVRWIIVKKRLQDPRTEAFLNLDSLMPELRRHYEVQWDLPYYQIWHRVGPSASPLLP